VDRIESNTRSSPASESIPAGIVTTYNQYIADIIDRQVVQLALNLSAIFISQGNVTRGSIPAFLNRLRHIPPVSGFPPATIRNADHINQMAVHCLPGIINDVLDALIMLDLSRYLLQVTVNLFLDNSFSLNVFMMRFILQVTQEANRVG
jgi:hypothetical protein